MDFRKHGNEPLGSIQGGDIFDQLNDCEIHWVILFLEHLFYRSGLCRKLF
jgi:hypothetical protein